MNSRGRCSRTRRSASDSAREPDARRSVRIQVSRTEPEREALSAVRAVPVMWEIASRFFDHFAFSPIKTDGRLLVRAMASLLFASASSQWLRLDSQEQLRRWSAGDFGEMAPLIWLRSINDLFLLSLNVVGVAGQQQQQSSAQGLGWPSCGRSAGGRHCRRAGRPTHRGERRLRPCWGDISSPASTGGSLAQLLLLGVLEHGLVCRTERIQPVLSSQRYYKPFNSQY